MSDDIVPDPVLIVEVLSASTAIVDTTIKTDEYCAIPSLRYDLMAEQDRIEATLLSRDGDGWAERTLCGLDAVLPLPALGIALPMAAIYDLVFTATSLPDAPRTG